MQRPRHVALPPVPGQAVLHGGAAAVLEDEHALQQRETAVSGGGGTRRDCSLDKGHGTFAARSRFCCSLWRRRMREKTEEEEEAAYRKHQLSLPSRPKWPRKGGRGTVQELLRDAKVNQG